MLSRVVIKNFKSIGEASVDLALKPLTILVGPNGAGKSTVLEAITMAFEPEATHSDITVPWLRPPIAAESLVHKGATEDYTLFFWLHGAWLCSAQQEMDGTSRLI